MPGTGDTQKAGEELGLAWTGWVFLTYTSGDLDRGDAGGVCLEL